MKKVALFACLVSGMAFAGMRPFTVSFAEPATIGGTQVKAGDYKCELQNDKVVLKHGHETAEAPVKVETAPRKFSATAVSLDRANGANKVESIEVGGTTTKLVFE
jgi:hypothetical protein